MTPHQDIDASARADDPARDAARADDTLQIASDLAYRRLAIVNVVFLGQPRAQDRGWVMIDAGLFGTKALILSAAEKRFGPRSRPSAIILTHGHFDHVGALEALAEEWNVPVYAHSLEHPYLNGSESYPPPDPTVGGGLMTISSALHMPGWRWLPTPGHSPGHVSLWRDSDRALVVGDAFVTTRQESVYAALTQKPDMHGPPMYYTPDWGTARESVRRLASLRPELVITGHGRAMRGPQMRKALERLATDFDAIAVPKRGRYVETAHRPSSPARGKP
jgi:glyoxylase-like metal-dependent hydrolase (beta-lactamase superfamily II)